MTIRKMPILYLGTRYAEFGHSESNGMGLCRVPKKNLGVLRSAPSVGQCDWSLQTH